ncbi:MAG: type I-E CRISPR-associated endoribonuclease Cas2e [Synechococcaceae cyanobacterium]
MILEKVPTVLRGELSRWLTPVGGGVHVGRVSALVRDQLWALALAKAGQGRVIQIWQCRGEPGYALRVHGLVASQLVDLEGLPMIAIKDAAWRQAMERFTPRPGPAMLDGSEKTSGPSNL